MIGLANAEKSFSISMFECALQQKASSEIVLRQQQQLVHLEFAANETFWTRNKNGKKKKK